MISKYSSLVGDYRRDSNPLCMKVAKKAYQDKMLTGLTDEDKAEIEKELKDYLNKHPVKCKASLEAYNNFMKGLMRKFGFKGDIDDFALVMSDEIESNFNTDERNIERNIVKKECVNLSALVYMSPLDFLETREKFFMQKD